MTSREEAPDQERRGYSYSRRNLYLSALGAYMLFVSVGSIMGWASPALPKLQEEGHNYSTYHRSLLSSIPGLAPGPLITIFGIDTIGRKGTLLTIWIVIVVAYAILCFTTNVIAMLIARFIGGWGMGAAFSAIGIYLGEISDVGMRGALNSISMIFLSVGPILCYIANLFLHYLGFCIVCLGNSLLFGLFYFFLPESPYYYVSKGKFERARSSLAYLRVGGPNECVEEELENVKNFIEEERKNKTGIRKLFTSTIVYKQFAVAIYLVYMQQATALNPIMSYTQEIFDKANLGINGAKIALALSIFSLLISIPVPFILKRFGAKKLFFLAGFGSGLSLAVLGIYFYLQNGGFDVSSVKYVPIIGMFGLNFLSYTGLGGIVWAVVTDLFAPSVKGAATGICGIISTFLGFIANEVFGLAKDHFGYGPTFLAFGICQIVASIGFFFVPDTTKMTLEEIQNYFERHTRTMSQM